MLKRNTVKYTSIINGQKIFYQNGWGTTNLIRNK